jgi:Transcriptional regulator
MEDKKSDRRTKYTKMVIKQALLDLMAENTLNKITVTDICKQADINRGTFYTYYSDPYDLLNQIEDEFFSEIRDVLEKSKILDNDYAFLVQILEYISKSRALCRIILDGDKLFVQKLVNLAHDKSISEYQALSSAASGEELELIFTFIANGIVGVIQFWLQNDLKQNPRELAELIRKMSISVYAYIDCGNK